MAENNKICIVGWHFSPKIYKYFKDNFLSSSYIVAHRYNKVLDELKLNYSVIKNIGLEFGAYDYYIKNIWDKKSDVLFMHDDVSIKNKFKFKDMLLLCNNLDHASFRNNSISSGGGRCLFLSKKLINLFLKKFGGIWFDKNDRGYTFGKIYFYDDIYYKLGDKKIWKDKVGINFKMTLSYLIKKYKLKSKDILYNKIDLYIRGDKKGKFTKMVKSNIPKLNDNSLFGISKNNELDKTASKYETERKIGKKGYTKWYNFYFFNIKYEDINLLEIGSVEYSSIEIWKKYFLNSNIYNIINEDLKETEQNIPYGIDIVIDNGRHNKNRIFVFEFLFNKLNAGGIYVLENLRKSYNEKNNNIVNYFKKKVDIMNFEGNFKEKSYEEIIYKNNKEIGFFEKRIASIHFYLGMCFIFKRYCK